MEPEDQLSSSPRPGEKEVDGRPPTRVLFFLGIIHLTRAYDLQRFYYYSYAFTFTACALHEEKREGLFSFVLTLKKLRPIGTVWIF